MDNGLSGALGSGYVRDRPDARSRKRNKKYAAHLIYLLPAALALTAGNAAADVPPRLFGKSLTLAWQTNRVEKNVGTGDIRRYGASATLKVYISSKGRLFAEKTGLVRSPGGWLHVGRSSEISDSPDRREIKEWRAEGASLVGYHQFSSGMRRMIVDFGNDYQTCSLKVSFAKQNGTENIIRGGGMWEIQSIEVSNPTCHVQAGNVFE